MGGQSSRLPAPPRAADARIVTMAPEDGSSATQPAAKAAPAVETRGLRKTFGRFVAVDDLSIDVGQGEVFGFLGPNGAGKTTSVKMLMGLTHPTAGEARLLGRSLGDREARRRIGFLPELFRFHDWLTGEEVLDLHARLYGMDTAERQRRIPEVLDLVGMYDRRRERMRSYSKGMQQRIGIAQALLPDPRLVFLDEPTSALDPIGRLDVRAIIQTLRAEGRTVFLNSHLLSEVESVCDRVAIINRGRVAAIGPMRELLSRELLVDLRLGRLDGDVECLVALYGDVREIRRNDGRPALVTVEVRDEESIAALVDALVRAGVPVFGATPHHQSLESLFFEVVETSQDGQPV